VAVSTVDEHLRKAESKILSSPMEAPATETRRHDRRRD